MQVEAEAIVCAVLTHGEHGAIVRLSPRTWPGGGVCAGRGGGGECARADPREIWCRHSSQRARTRNFRKRP